MRHHVNSIDPDNAANAEVLTLPKSSMLNKVPEITIFFWIFKVLATTIGGF